MNEKEDILLDVTTLPKRWYTSNNFHTKSFMVNIHYSKRIHYNKRLLIKT